MNVKIVYVAHKVSTTETAKKNGTVNGCLWLTVEILAVDCRQYDGILLPVHYCYYCCCCCCWCFSSSQILCIASVKLRHNHFSIWIKFFGDFFFRSVSPRHTAVELQLIIIITWWIHFDRFFNRKFDQRVTDKLKTDISTFSRLSWWN